MCKIYAPKSTRYNTRSFVLRVEKKEAKNLEGKAIGILERRTRLRHHVCNRVAPPGIVCCLLVCSGGICVAVNLANASDNTHENQYVTPARLACICQRMTQVRGPVDTAAHLNENEFGGILKVLQHIKARHPRFLGGLQISSCLQVRSIPAAHGVTTD